MFRYLLGSDIASYVSRHRSMVVCALCLTAVASIFVVIPAYLLQPFVDQGMQLGPDPVTWKIPWIEIESGAWWRWHKTDLVVVEQITPDRLLMLLSLVAFIAALLKAVAVYFGNLAAAAFSTRVVTSLRVDLFRKFIELPLTYHHKQKSGELVGRATADLTVLQGHLSRVVMGLIEQPLTAAAFLIFLLLMNYRLTLLVFLLSPPVLGLIRLFGRKVKKHAVRMQDATARVTAAYQEALTCLRVIHGFFQGEAEVRRFNERAQFLYRRVMRWHRWDLAVSPMMDVTGFVLLPAVLILGRVYFDHSLGELTSMIFAFSRVYMPIKKLAKVNNNLRTLQGATQRVFGIMNTVPEIQDAPGAVVLPPHRKEIAFHDVDFAYNPHDLILHRVSFRVRFGEMAAFVGSTGAGKSTLLDLVPRFYDVTGGSITIDGRDIREVTLASLRGQIGIVSQDVVLFHETIANNIRYGRPQSTMDEVMTAAKAAHAHDFILAQPRGYDTVVGDQGALLSGGQRQRIAIARALLINPAILILDEAASALDAESETLVQRTIQELRGRRTILVVAHRLSTIMKADWIYVLEAGRIIEQGTREDLLARKKSRFRHLYELQYAGAPSGTNP